MTDEKDTNFYNLMFHQPAIKQGFMEIMIPKKNQYVQRWFMLKTNILIHCPKVDNLRVKKKEKEIGFLLLFAFY